MVSDLITVLANLALTLSFVVALIFGIVQVRAANRDRRERFAVDAVRNFQTREFAEMIHYITAHKVPQSAEELRNCSEDEQVTFIQLSQTMESLGLQVAAKLIDIGLVDRTLGSFVTAAWEKYKPVIVDIRDKNSDPYLGEYFQWLAEQIDKEMKNNPREPYHLKSK